MIKRIGLIVNPIAGLGGKSALKGSDDPNIRQKAKELGVIKGASLRAEQAFNIISTYKSGLQVITCPGEMGEEALRNVGFNDESIRLIGRESCKTTYVDTQLAAKEMVKMGVNLLLFAGGDGTARDIYSAIGMSVPVIGIPAGVKIHSSVYAINPRNAGEVALMSLKGQTSMREAEVIDIDETAFQEGKVITKLYGYLNVPAVKNRMQGIKVGSGGLGNTRGIVMEVVSQLNQDTIYIIGPGTTPRSIMEKLNLNNTLLGVDIIANGQVIANDVSEQKIWDVINSSNKNVEIIITPIGGQGHIFGRGNQQISPRIIKKVGKEGVLVVSTKEKIYALPSFRLLVDTGDQLVDEQLCGYVRVITGFEDYMICSVNT